MSITIQKEEKYNQLYKKEKSIIDELRKPGVASLLFFCYVYPRTQKEVGKLINPNKRICFNPLIKWRERLVKVGALEIDSLSTMKNIKWKTNATFLTKFCLAKIDEARSKSKSPHLYELTENEKILLEKFFGSKWFRGFFSDNYLHLIEKDERKVWRDESGKLWVSDALGEIISIATIIFAISYAFYHHYKSSLFPTDRDIVNIETFKNFAERWYEKRLKNKVNEKEIRKILKELEHYPSEFIKQLTKDSLSPPYYVFSIPPKFYEVFSLTFRHSSYMYEVASAIDRVVRYR
jgi:hypothetical protein